MANKAKGKTTSNKSSGSQSPKSAQHAANGIRTGHDFANLMSALMCDLIEGRVAPSVGNATCNAGGKLLKVVEMQFRYGTQNGDDSKTLILSVSDTPSLKQLTAA